MHTYEMLYFQNAIISRYCPAIEISFDQSIWRKADLFGQGWGGWEPVGAGGRIQKENTVKARSCLALCDQLWTPGALNCSWLGFYGSVAWNASFQTEHISGNLGVPNHLGTKIGSPLLESWGSESHNGWTEKVGTVLVSVCGTHEKCL